MMKPTLCSAGQILIPKQALLQKDPRLTGPEKLAILAAVGIFPTGEERQGRKNSLLTWSVCQSTSGWHGKSSEDKETIQTELFDAKNNLRGFARVDWFNAKETPDIHFRRRYNHHVPAVGGDQYASDEQTGVVIKTMSRALEVRPEVKAVCNVVGVWDWHHMQTMFDLMKWLDEHYPLWHDPLAYWD